MSLEPDKAIMTAANLATDVPADEETQFVASAGASAAVAGQWTLMLWKFRRQKVAMASLVVVLLLYLVAVLAEFLAPYGVDMTRPQYTYAPPQGISLFVTTADDGWQFLPHASGYKIVVDQEAMRRTFEVDPEQVIPIGLFVTGETYKLWGLFESNLHFIGPIDPTQTVYFLGSDRIGRDVLSRLIYGTRISMSIGLVGVVISLALGLSRRHLGLLRWRHRHSDPAARRSGECHADYSAVDGAGCGDPAHLATGIGLFHRDGDRLAARLDLTG